MSALGVEKPELCGSKGFYVSVAVENGKSVAILEHTRAVVSQCGRSSNIILIFYPDNVRQNETVLESEQRVDLPRLRGKRLGAQHRLV